MPHATVPPHRALLLLIALLVPLLAACAGSGAPATGTSTAASAAASTASDTTAASASAAPAESAAASTAAPSVAGSTGGKVLRVHVGTYPDVVDPQKSSFANEINILSLNYEGLTKLDKDLKAVPAAAEKWEFNDSGDVITFTLRSGLTYSDGSPLTAENFRYAVERTCDPKTAGEYQSILFEIVGCADWASTPVTDTAAYDAGRANLAQGVEAPDERTLVLRLTNPAPYYTYVAALWVMYPAKQELIEAGGEDWWKDPANQIGNGPFKLVQMAEDQLDRLEANTNYWEGRPKLDGLEFVYIGDSSVALEAYRAGQLDVFTVEPSQIPALKSDPALSKELMIYTAASTAGWGFNLNLEPFNDKKVREAFAYAIDRQTYCDVIRNGDCVPALSWIPEGVAGSIQTDAYSYDPEKARQALAESSYGGPESLPPIKLSYNSDDPATQPRIEWIAGQLRENLGIEAQLDPIDGTTLVNMRKSNETYPQACLFCANWNQDYPDPQNWMSVYWRSNATGATRVGYKSAEFDALVNQADVELDPAKRAELYQQASQVLVDDLPTAFMYHLANVFLVKPELTGYTQTVGDSSYPGQWGSWLTLDLNR